MLEAGTAALAAQLATAEELATLDRLVDEMAGLRGRRGVRRERPRASIASIALASRNDVVVALLDNLSSRTTRARVWRGLTQSRAYERTVEEHRAIYEALAAKRGDIAVRGDDRPYRRAWTPGSSTPPRTPSPPAPEGRRASVRRYGVVVDRVNVSVLE